MAEASKPNIILATNSRVFFRWPSPDRKEGGEKDSRDLVTEPIKQEQARKKKLRASVSSAQKNFSEKNRRIRV